MIKKVLSYFLVFSLLISLFSSNISAENAYVRGDLDNNGAFNAIDLVLLRKYLFNGMTTQSYSADINVDNIIDLRDLVRMKKYLTGDVTHSNSTNVGMSWVILDGDGDVPIVSGVGYRIYTNCYTRTVCSPDRYVTEVSAYISTDRNPNPELDSPQLTIATTTINDDAVNMEVNHNNIVPENKIFESKISYSEINVPNRSTYSCLFTVMMTDKCISPYRETTNIFDF